MSYSFLTCFPFNLSVALHFSPSCWTKVLTLLCRGGGGGRRGEPTFPKKVCSLQLWISTSFENDILGNPSSITIGWGEVQSNLELSPKIETGEDQRCLNCVKFVIKYNFSNFLGSFGNWKGSVWS